MSDKTIRILSGLLAVDSAVYLLAAWLSPIGWASYLVWAGWVCIAVFNKLTTRVSFWMLSLAENGLLLFYFWESTHWSIGDKYFAYWHCRLHLLVATFVSLYTVMELAARNLHLTRDKLPEETS